MQAKTDHRFRTGDRHSVAPVRNAAPIGLVTGGPVTGGPVTGGLVTGDPAKRQRMGTLGRAVALILIGLAHYMPAVAQENPVSNTVITSAVNVAGDQARPDEIIWSNQASKQGLLVGVKLDPPDGRVRAGETLELQFVLRNDSPEEQHVRCLNGTERFLEVDIRDGNYLFPSGFSTRPGYDEIQLLPGEIYEAENHRAEFSTQGLLDGEYTFFPLGAYNVSTTVSATRATGYVSGVVFTVGDGKARLSPPPDRTPSLQIYWGEAQNGLALGAQLVRLEDSGLYTSYRQRSGRYTVNEELEMQLHLANLSDQTQVVDIELASETRWPIAIRSENNRTWQRRARSDNGARIRLQIAPGEQRPLTGAEVPFLRANASADSLPIPRAVANAKVHIGDNAAATRKPGEVHPDFGGHHISTNLTVRPAASNTLKIELRSGNVPFRVVPPLPESE